MAISKKRLPKISHYNRDALAELHGILTQTLLHNDTETHTIHRIIKDLQAITKNHKNAELQMRARELLLKFYSFSLTYRLQEESLQLKREIAEAGLFLKTRELHIQEKTDNTLSIQIEHIEGTKNKKRKEKAS